MRYWNTNEELEFDTYSTNYLQVTCGNDKNYQPWAKDSLYLEGGRFDSLDGMRVLRETGALPTFDFYYDTTVYREDWERMEKILTDLGGEYAIFVSELADWVGQGFKTHDCFCIRGI